MHSAHPTISEYLEPLGFRDSAREFEKRETGGFRDVEEITLTHPIVYGQPGKRLTKSTSATSWRQGASLYPGRERSFWQTKLLKRHILAPDKLFS